MGTMNARKRIYVFVDAANMWDVQKSKGRFIRYETLQAYIKLRFAASEVRIFYYEAYPAEGTRNYDLASKHKFFAYLAKRLKFQVRKKPLKRIQATNGQQRVIEKGNMDVELAIDVVHHHRKYETAVLLTGDSDFYALVKYLQAREKEVYVMSSRGSISEELRVGSNGYMDIRNIHAVWGKEIRHRNKLR